MAPAKDFWVQACEELNYRFFTGIPFAAVADLYKTMNPTVMHYIPAAHEDIAVKMATGAWISGFKSAVILESEKIINLDLSFNFRNKIPILFITDSNNKSLLLSSNVFSDNLTVTFTLEEADNYIENEAQPTIFIYG